MVLVLLPPLSTGSFIFCGLLQPLWNWNSLFQALLHRALGVMGFDHQFAGNANTLAQHGAYLDSRPPQLLELLGLLLLQTGLQTLVFDQLVSFSLLLPPCNSPTPASLSVL